MIKNFGNKLQQYFLSKQSIYLGQIDIDINRQRFSYCMNVATE